jgi:hypothetical protein
MATSQCVNHSSQLISGACRCVTVKVISPVAVRAVKIWGNRIVVYIARNGSYSEKKFAAQKI